MRVLNRFLTVAACVTTVVAAAAQGGAPPNTLTPSEKAAGWMLLFDGSTTAGWRGFHSETFPAAGWVAENGAIKTMGSGPSGGDIITIGQFDNFELKLEWKIGPGGNTGVKSAASKCVC